MSNALAFFLGDFSSFLYQKSDLLQGFYILLRPFYPDCV